MPTGSDLQNTQVWIDENNPEASAQDDQVGQICMHKDLRPKMEYRGYGLVWTGRMVHKDFLDEPNPQGLAPVFPPDPLPVSNPRPFVFNPADPSTSIS